MQREDSKERLLDTIGTTRGFGDHDLKVAFCSLPIKPFLTPQPEVSDHLVITSGSVKTEKWFYIRSDCIITKMR